MSELCKRSRFEYDVPVGRPDASGKVFTKEAALDTIKNMEKRPVEVTVRNSEGETLTIAVLNGKNLDIRWDEESQTYHVTCDGELTEAGRKLIYPETSSISMELDEGENDGN